MSIVCNPYINICSQEATWFHFVDFLETHRGDDDKFLSSLGQKYSSNVQQDGSASALVAVEATIHLVVMRYCHIIHVKELRLFTSPSETYAMKY